MKSPVGLSERPYTEDDITTLIEMFHDGDDDETIAELLDRTPFSVQRKRRELNLLRKNGKVSHKNPPIRPVAPKKPRKRYIPNYANSTMEEIEC